MQYSYQERGPCIARTLDSMKSDLKAFQEDGAKKQRAKDVSFSVVRETMMPIEIDHVS